MRISSWKIYKAVWKLLFVLTAGIGLGVSFWYEGKFPCPSEFVLDVWIGRVVLFACAILYAVSFVKGIQQEKTIEWDTLGWLLGSLCLALMAWIQDVELAPSGLWIVGAAVFVVGALTAVWDIWRF